MAKLQTRIFEYLDNIKQNYADTFLVAGKSDTEWKTYNIHEFCRITDSISRGFIEQGLKKGDRIAIISGNRPEWNFIDFACNQIGLVTVPLYPTLSEKDLVYILQNADVKKVFASTHELYQKMEECVRKQDISLDIYTFEEVEGCTHYSHFIKLGKNLITDLNPYRESVHEDDLLTLIYTSGTTGRPKGVLLTHRNLMSNVLASQHFLKPNCIKAVSFLPLCHIFERMVIYIYFYRGLQIYYSESLDHIVEDIREVQPHLFTTVPRVLEKVYDAIIAKGKELTGLKKSLFFWAVDLGHKFQEPPNNPFFYKIKLTLARKLIFSKWKEALGGKVELIVSGGAALQERLGRIFWAADIQVLEGYGLTETSPVMAVNSWEEGGLKFGTVGKTLNNIEVKIAEDGEILVKGPSVSPGYFNDEAATKEAFDENGFLKTGDIGTLSEDGFLKITDRKKEMFKTAGGKYIAPQTVENKLSESLVIGQVIVVGENQRFPSALIVPAFEELEKWAKHKSIPYQGALELLSKPEVLDKYQREVDKANQDLGQWETIKKFVLLPKAWTIESGEITPKLSLKRKVILSNYADIIENIYK